jgi:hypothetical protein
VPQTRGLTTFISHDSGDWEVKVEVPAKPLPTFQTVVSSRDPHPAEDRESASKVSGVSYQGTNPTPGAPPSSPNHHLKVSKIRIKG